MWLGHEVWVWDCDCFVRGSLRVRVRFAFRIFSSGGLHYLGSGYGANPDLGRGGGVILEVV